MDRAVSELSDFYFSFSLLVDEECLNRVEDFDDFALLD